MVVVMILKYVTSFFYYFFLFFSAWQLSLVRSHVIAVWSMLHLKFEWSTLKCYPNWNLIRKTGKWHHLWIFDTNQHCTCPKCRLIDCAGMLFLLFYYTHCQSTKVTWSSSIIWFGKSRLETVILNLRIVFKKFVTFSKTIWYNFSFQIGSCP